MFEISRAPALRADTQEATVESGLNIGLRLRRSYELLLHHEAYPYVCCMQR